jgi:hypothetical protein
MIWKLDRTFLKLQNAIKFLKCPLELGSYWNEKILFFIHSRINALERQLFIYGINSAGFFRSSSSKLEKNSNKNKQ